MRKVYITGEIDHAAYRLFAEDMSELEQLPNKPITVEICSGGGIANVAYAFVSRIRLSACEVHTIGMGEIASAATIILASGDKRAMTKESLLMVHEDQGVVEGSISEIEKEISDCRSHENHWNKIFSDLTKKPVYMWEKLNQRTTWLDAKKCLELGIIDKII